MLYGIATTNNSPVIFDPFDASLLNANEVVFAKSPPARATRPRSRRPLPQRGVDFLVVDPEGRVPRRLRGGRRPVPAAGLVQPAQAEPVRPAAARPTADEGRDPLAEQVAAVLGCSR